MAPANFSNLSSPEIDDEAVDAIVSQTIDRAVLDQITSLNSSSHVLSTGRAGDEADSDISSSPPKPRVARESETKLRSGFGSSPSISWRESPSPPRQVCCFGCSCSKASKVSRRKKGITTSFGKKKKKKKDDDEEEVLSDLSTLSLREQRRRMKKALEEEERVRREAEKVVEWVKQASARFDVSTIDELVGGDKKISK